MPSQLEGARRGQFLKRSFFSLTRVAAPIAAVLTLAAGAVAPLAHADQFSLDLNDDTARVSYVRPTESRKTQIDASFLRNQDRGNVFAVGFHLTGNAATQERPVNAGVGVKLYLVDTEVVRIDTTTAEEIGRNGGGLAVGGFFDAKIPNYNRFGVGGHVYYVADVLSYNQVEDLLDVSVHASYAILRDGDLYVGLRNVKSNFDLGTSQTFDTGLHIGFRLNF